MFHNNLDNVDDPSELTDDTYKPTEPDDTDIPTDTADTDEPTDTDDTDIPTDTADTGEPPDTADTDIPTDTADTDEPTDTDDPNEPTNTDDSNTPATPQQPGPDDDAFDPSLTILYTNPPSIIRKLSLCLNVGHACVGRVTYTLKDLYQPP